MDCKTIISLQFEAQESQCEAFKLPAPWAWMPMNMVIGHQILGRPHVDGITQRPSPSTLILVALWILVSRTELKDAMKVLSFGFIF